MNHTLAPIRPGHWGLLMKHCCSSPSTHAQLLQFKVVHAHHFHTCCCDLRSLSGSAAVHGGHSQTGKTMLVLFFLHTAITSLYCPSKSTKRTTQGTTGGCVYESGLGSLALIATLDTPASPPSPDTIY